MVARWEHVDGPQDGSVTAFVDDLFRIIIPPDGKWTTAEELLRMDGDMLDKCVGKNGYLQNHDKEEVVASFRSRKENWSFFEGTDTTLRSKRLHDMKHLGGFFNPFGTFTRERAARKMACLTGWSSLKGLWFSTAHFRVKRLLFQGVVQSRAIDGLESYYLTDFDYNSIDKWLSKKLRAIASSSKGPQEEGAPPRMMSLDEVWKHWRIAPTRTELRVRRLKWWQSICRQPEIHGHFLAIFFGRCRFEDQAAEDGGNVAPPTLDDNGFINEQAHPLARQLAADLKALHESKTAAEALEGWNGAFLPLLTGE